MTVTEVLVIVSGLAIGYWLVAVFLPNARHGRGGGGGDAPDATTVVDIGAPAWHEVLGIAPDADRDAIHEAYRRRSEQYRADKVANLAPELRELAERRAVELDVAYDRALMQLHDRGA